MASEPKPYLSEHRPGREPLSYITLVNMFDPNINTGVNAAEMAGDKVPFEQIANYGRLGHAELVIQDLERLGILTHEPVLQSPQNRPKLRSDYSLTQYGVSFVRAVTIKAENAPRSSKEEKKS